MASVAASLGDALIAHRIFAHVKTYPCARVGYQGTVCHPVERDELARPANLTRTLAVNTILHLGAWVISERALARSVDGEKAAVMGYGADAAIQGKYFLAGVRIYRNY